MVEGWVSKVGGEGAVQIGSSLGWSGIGGGNLFVVYQRFVP